MKRNLIHNLLLLLVLACNIAQLATSPDILKRTFSETAFIERFIDLRCWRKRAKPEA